MMRHVLMLAVFLAVPAASAHAGERVGVLTAMTLAGADADAADVVRRHGKGEAAALYMPLEEGDTVTLSDAASRLAIEISGKPLLLLEGPVTGHVISGDRAVADEAYALAAWISGLLAAGEEDTTSTTMVARGGDLRAPLAVPGRSNLLEPGTRRLTLFWSGGKAPYRVTLEATGVAGGQPQVTEQQATLFLPAAERFSVEIMDADAVRLKLSFRVAEKMPVPPVGLADPLAAAAFLLRAGQGEWRMAAAQRLNRLAAENPAAARLLKALQ